MKPLGIQEQMAALAEAATHTNVELRDLASKLAEPEPDIPSMMRAFVDELHRRFTYRADPIQETIGPVPWEPGRTVDVDDACLFVAALASSVGIRCRFVAERYGSAWTCRVAYSIGHRGVWRILDVLRQNVDRAPDEKVFGPEVEIPMVAQCPKCKREHPVQGPAVVPEKCSECGTAMIRTRKKWRKCTMAEAMRHASTRTIENENLRRQVCADAPGDVVLFTDGTAIACKLQYGSAESGARAESHEFWIGEP